MKHSDPIEANNVPSHSGSNYPEPYKSRMGDAAWRPIGDWFNLTQFGVNLETLKPGAESALRHWHHLEDEFVYVLSGELVLRTDGGECTLTAGMCIGFKAGVKNAHHLVNRSGEEACFIIIGSRVPGDMAFYPDDDLAWFNTEDGNTAVHKNGEPYPAPDPAD